MPKKQKNDTGQISHDFKEQLADLEAQVQQAQEATRRSQADYQNLVRRSQQERAAVVKLATKDLVSALLQPIEHLEMAAKQLNDNGLNMVLYQFKQTLQQFGVEEIEVAGQLFDVETMEAVENESGDENLSEAKVTEVRSKGYRLNGEVIQHAKVVVSKN